MCSRIVFFMIALMFSSTSYATCTITNAKIEDVFSFQNSVIFLSFGQAANCNCLIPSRVGFNTAGHEAELSIALAALLADKEVSVVADDTSCAIHGNTAELQELRIWK